MSYQLYVPFSLILKDSNGLISEICYLLEQLEADKRKWILQTMQQYRRAVLKSEFPEDNG